jgi:hypothetical protein
LQPSPACFPFLSYHSLPEFCITEIFKNWASEMSSSFSLKVEFSPKSEEWGACSDCSLKCLREQKSGRNLWLSFCLQRPMIKLNLKGLLIMHLCI